MSTKEIFKKYKCSVIIPTYNNDKTLRVVIESVLIYSDDIILVNDGSTDSTEQIVKDYPKLTVITHGKNKGKGMALRNGFKSALKLGYDYAITIDSDSQHFASDLPLFLAEIEKNPDTLVIGARNMEQENVPGKSSFGNKFSNFWYHLETGIKLQDTQSGYRLYPIRRMKNLRYFTRKFEFEIEVIVKAAWKGIPVKNIPIKVHYEPGKLRISHFRPFRDFSRISLLNTWLVTLAFLYYIPLRFINALTRENIKNFIKKNFFNETEPSHKKALAIGFGMFMGIFPIWGYQLIVGLTLCHLMRLNKVIFVVAANISIPPMIPVIIYASYMLGGVFIESPEYDIFFNQGLTLEAVKDNLVQYLIGAVALSIVAGIVSGLISYIYLKIYRARKTLS
ncbi:MAG: DUF2062 domain-containing protein [Candidatus Cyclobacteriaceae bacterium M2_1C_046]